MCNDNVRSRHLYNGDDFHGPRMRLLYHVPSARELIKRHVSHVWKHSVSGRDYAFVEYQLCTIMDSHKRFPAFREITIKTMAKVLDVNPIQLYNDPRLPI